MIKKKMNERNKGITLIALIVTIIVLLILSGVTLSTILGKDGIINKAQQAVEKYKNSALEEKIAISILEKEMQIEVSKIEDPNPGELEEIDQNVYAINSIEDLVGFSNKVNLGQETYERKTVVLLASLDFQNENSYANYENTDLFGDYNQDGVTEGIKDELTKGRGFVPIGNKADYNAESNALEGKRFKGTFNGSNKEIRNILIKVDETEQSFGIAGLFGIGDATAKISNLAISGDISCSNSTENGKSYAGGIVGYNGSQITSCYNKANINCGNSYLTYIGGIIGGNNSRQNNIENCINSGKINGQNTKSYIFAGGIIGYNSSGNIIKAKNQEIIKSTNPDGGAIHTGGIVGYNSGTIEESLNSSEVISDGSTASVFAAGIAGKNFSKIANSENKGKITAKNSKSTTYGNFAGGITGESSETGIISNCNNYAEINNEGSISKYVYIGGISAKSSGIIESAKNQGNVNCNGENIVNIFLGGITGSNNGGTLKNAQNNGEIRFYAHASNWIEMGGIVGTTSQDSLIEECKNTKDIYIESETGNLTIAGIAGITTDTNLEKCINLGNINVKQKDSTKGVYTAGLVAYNGTNTIQKSIDQSVNYGNISSDGGLDVYIGGISGYLNNNIITNTYNRGNVTTTNAGSWCFGGGIAGSNSKRDLEGYVDKCYNSGKIDCTGKVNTYAGGIIGSASANITNCYNIGALNSTTIGTTNDWAYAGGIVGLNYSSIIENNYNSGIINATTFSSGGGTRIAGIVGEQGTGTTRNCYYTSSSAAIGLGQNNSGIAENITVRDNMPTILEILKDPFKTNPQDATCPLLSWE